MKSDLKRLSICPFTLKNVYKMKLFYLIKEIWRKFTEKREIPDSIECKYKIPQELKKSLKFRVVDAGDDEWTMAELYALEWPAYPLENYWISFGASPKHVDWLIVVGATTKNMKDAVVDAWSKIPSPKILVALGDKAINWDDRFTEVFWSVKDIFPNEQIIEIPWNPPSAKTIFSYLVSLTK